MSNILGVIGLAKRANKVTVGVLAMNDILDNRSKLVLISKYAGQNSQKKFIDKCNYYHVPYYMVENAFELSLAIGKKNCKCFSINDKNFAKLILENLEEKEGGMNGKNTK